VSRVKRVAAILSAAILLAPVWSTAAPAQTDSAVMVPGFWDPRRRPERPDLSRITVIRFLTEIDYPPFNYAGPDGNPAGFNIDLARLICEEIKANCPVPAPISATLIIARRRVSSGGGRARSPTYGRSSSRAARSPWSPAPRMRSI
jgi:polar amino acid transport system substrate-binding protein